MKQLPLALKYSKNEVFLSSVLISTIKNRSTLNKTNPTLKFGGGLILGLLLKKVKNKYTKEIGNGLIISNTSNWIYDIVINKKCNLLFLIMSL